MGRLIDAESDLIERSEVLKQLWLNHNDVVYIDKNECARRIEAIPSARPKGEWMPFETRPTDDEEREYFKSDTILDGKLPDDGDGILVSKGKYVWADTFVSDELGAWLDGYGEIEDGMAWMPLPQPYGERKESE